MIVIQMYTQLSDSIIFCIASYVRNKGKPNIQCVIMGDVIIFACIPQAIVCFIGYESVSIWLYSITYILCISLIINLI